MNRQFEAVISILNFAQGASAGGILAVVLFLCWQVGSGHL